MAKTGSTTHSFRLTAAERSAIEFASGSLSIGEFARRAALNTDVTDRTGERIALGKIIRAIHLAIASEPPADTERRIRLLLKEALAVIGQTSSTKKLKTLDDPVGDLS